MMLSARRTLLHAYSPPFRLRARMILRIALGVVLTLAVWTIWTCLISQRGLLSRSPLPLIPRPDIPKGLCSNPTRVLDYGESSFNEGGGLATTNGLPKLRNSARVLIVAKSSYSHTHRAIAEILVANRIKYKTSIAGKNLPDLIKISKGVGNYGVIFFEDFHSFLEMDSWNRDLLHKYCKMFNVGIVSFVSSDEGISYSDSQLEDSAKDYKLPLYLSTVSNLSDYSVNASTSMIRITRGGQTLHGPVDMAAGSSGWVSFRPTHETFTGVAWASMPSEQNDRSGEKKIVVVQDHGKLDDIPKVLFGGSIDFWVNKLLFLDSLSWTSNGRISVPLIRYLLIDIDDVFVGTTRFVQSDVTELLASQKRIAAMVPGFRYNLGFSGGFYHKVQDPAALQGDDELLNHKDSFWWFPHMWRHLQPHTFDNASELVGRMMLNKKFSEEFGIKVSHNYSVAPHHSGVYPVHEPLYEAWRKVWGIEVTSTEEYPHLRPARLRRGFIHSGVAVLPRQTCGLYTKNVYYYDYPGGPDILEKSIHGGELFQTIVDNPISIFMTHMPNYCGDRLAPYTFESVIQMLQCWTKLDLRTRNPKILAEIYFEMFPEENPCDDHRHLDIWAPGKSCDRLPDFVVIGPQKTGSTALMHFLQMHPGVANNRQSPDTFEETQFFSGPSYERGIDWYMDLFPPRPNGTFLFEKSATYFDRDFVPKRVSRLLKSAQIVAILVSPVTRAYSWYQHMRAHDDPTALHYTFKDVITASDSAPKALRQLQSRCLDPGNYASHLERWLNFYKPHQLHIVDGEELKYDPVSVLNRLQRSLGIQPFMDYANHLKFDRKKGFFCELTSANKTKCLGRSKGRHYPPIQPECSRLLRAHYRLQNEALVKLLDRLDYPVPSWLEDDLRDEKAAGDAVDTDDDEAVKDALPPE